MRKTVLRTLIVIAAVALVGAGAAQAIKLRIGNIVIVGDGGFTPNKLPKNVNAPIKLFGHASFKTVDGTRPSPLRTLTLEFDKHGAVETRGLQKCTMGKLVATTTKVARKLCSDAIVGKGFGTAVVELPEQRPIKASSPLTLFNGPVKHGNPTVLGHAHIDYPGPTTYVILIEIQKVHHGRYGFKTVANFPRIVNDYGSPISGPPDDRQGMDVQGQAAELRQRPLRRRAPAGQGRVQLQGRQLRPGHDLQTLQGAQVGRATLVPTGVSRR